MKKVFYYCEILFRIGHVNTTTANKPIGKLISKYNINGYYGGNSTYYTHYMQKVIKLR